MISIFVIFVAVFLLVYIVLEEFIPKNKNEEFDIRTFNTPIHKLDYLDDDILRMYNVDLNQCIEMCETDEQCKGFVYVPRDNLCKFKSTFDKPTFSRGHISFLKKD